MRLRLDHPYLLLTLCSLFWAGNWVVGRGFRADVPPMALAFWRWVTALACVLPFAWPHLTRQWPVIRRHWKIIAFLGALGTGLYNALVYVGLQTTTATNGVLLNSFIPVVILGITWGALGRRLHRVEWIGAAISLSGVVTIVSQGSLATLAALTLNVGDAWILASVLGWATYTVCLPRRPPDLHPLAFLAALSIAGLIALLPFYLAELATGARIHLSTAATLGILYTGVFPAFLGYIFWNRGVAEVGGHQAGLFMHLMPVFGVVLSALFLAEYPQPYHWLGIALILGGIVLTTRRPSSLP